MEQTTTYALLVAASISIGYWAGISSRRSLTTRSSKSETTDASVNEFGRVKAGSSLPNDGDVPSNKLNHEDCKLVLVVRTDLGMSSGKIAAQCSHATLACYQTLQSTNIPLLKHWERTGQTKVALRCASNDELLQLQARARSLNLCARSIQDAGRTQIAAGSRTVLGILGPSRLINQITGTLRLL